MDGRSEPTDSVANLNRRFCKEDPLRALFRGIGHLILGEVGHTLDYSNMLHAPVPRFGNFPHWPLPPENETELNICLYFPNCASVWHHLILGAQFIHEDSSPLRKAPLEDLPYKNRKTSLFLKKITDFEGSNFRKKHSFAEWHFNPITPI